METLIVKYLSGEASEAEAKMLTEWIASNADHEMRYLAAKKVFDAANNYYGNKGDEIPEINIDHEWTHFKNKINRNETPVIPIQRNLTGLTWTKLAAALVILAVSAFIVVKLTFSDNEILLESKGESMAFTLPDGSSGMLNQHSSLSYQPSFGTKNRMVLLKGEAYFDVVHDGSKPFIVRSGATTIEDIGTAFDIRSYPEKDQVEVTVEKGEIKFTATKIGTSINLMAGQSAVFDKSSIALQPSSASVNALAWRTHKIVFNETNLASVVETLNRAYNTHITISRDVPPSCVLTVTFDKQSLDAVLHVLETTLNLTFRKSAGKIEITHAGC